MPKTHQQLAVAAFRTAFMQPNLESAKEHFGRAITALEKRLPEAARCAREAEEDVLTTMSCPVAHGRQIRSTNPLERLNREIRRRTDVVGIFPVPRCCGWSRCCWSSSTTGRRRAKARAKQGIVRWSVGRRTFSQESMAALFSEAAPLQIAAK